MELEHSFSVPVPEERAWDVLLDVERVAPCMPGATLQSIDGDEIHGSIKVKVGPITMTYQGTARFTERDSVARVVTLEASGKETRGAGTASAKVRSMLEGAGEATTHVVVHTTLNVTGRPAQFGRGVITDVGGRLIGMFAENLATMLSAERVSGGSGDGLPFAGRDAEPAAPSAEEALPIDVLNLTVRAWNSLRRDGIQTLGDLVRRTPEQLLAIGNIGPASVAEISSKLADRGLALAGAAGTAGAEGAAAHSAGAVGPGGAGFVPAEKAAANGGPAAGGPAADGPAADGGSAADGGPAQEPREPVGWQRDEAIDLIGVAGLPVLKRAVPVLAGLVALVLVVLGVRRRARLRRG